VDLIGNARGSCFVNVRNEDGLGLFGCEATAEGTADAVGAAGNDHDFVE
jgi:hypothetical protein